MTADDDLLTVEEADALAAPFRRPLPGPPRTLEDYRRTPTRPARQNRPYRPDTIITVTPPASRRDLETYWQRTYRGAGRRRHLEAVQAALGCRWDLTYIRGLLADARATSRAMRGLL